MVRAARVLTATSSGAPGSETGAASLRVTSGSVFLGPARWSGSAQSDAALALRWWGAGTPAHVDTWMSLAGVAGFAGMVGYGYLSASHLLSERLTVAGRFDLYVPCAIAVGGVACVLLGTRRGAWLCLSLPLLLLPTSNYTFFVCVRSSQNTHFWLSTLAAALALVARLMRPLRPELRRSGQVILLCLGVVLAGWIDVCWSTTHMEWEVLTGGFSVEQIRRNILLFSPLLVLRYAIPVLVFRLVVGAQLGPLDHAQQVWLWTAIGVKLAAVVATTLGIGLAVGTTSFFLEGVQHAAILLTLSLGLMGMRAAPAGGTGGESSFVWGLSSALLPNARRAGATGSLD